MVGLAGQVVFWFRPRPKKRSRPLSPPPPWRMESTTAFVMHCPRRWRFGGYRSARF